MRRGKLPRHLMQKSLGGTFYACLDIPKDVRTWFEGKPRFVASLHTTSLQDAEVKKWSHLLHWKKLIEDCRSGRGAEALMREHVAAADTPLERAMLDEAHHNAATDAAEQGDLSVLGAYRRVHSGWVRLADRVPAWLEQKERVDQISPATVSRYRVLLNKFCSSFEYLHEVTPEGVSEWLQQGDKLRLATLRKQLTTIKLFLRFCGADLNFSNAFASVPKDKRHKRKNDQRRHLEDEHIRDLLGASDGALRDLILLGAYTGARLGELCNLRTENVTPEVLKIRDAKTDAGDRDIPIHSAIKQIVARLVDTSTDGFLISGQKANAHGDRTYNLSKRFSLLKISLGFDDRYVFHSLRKSFITKLERAEVRESTIARLVGHQIDQGRSLALGLYSGGLTTEQLAASVERVTYRL